MVGEVDSEMPLVESCESNQDLRNACPPGPLRVQRECGERIVAGVHASRHMPDTSNLLRSSVSLSAFVEEGQRRGCEKL